MPFLRHHEEQVVDGGSEELHALARQKVQQALAGLGRRTADEAASPAAVPAVADVDSAAPVPQHGEDAVLRQALDRMHEQLGDVCALDRDGRELTWAELARVVIGPLPATVRDAYTTAALLQAVAMVPVLSSAEAELPAQQPSLQDAHLYDRLRAENLDAWGEAARGREDRLMTALEDRHAEPGSP